MASIDDAIFARLAASTGITGLTSTSGIYNLQASQGAVTPFIVFNVLSHGAVDSADGIDRLTGARLQIDCYSADKDEAALLALRVRQGIGGFSGESAGIRVTRCLGPRTSFAAYESETRLYREMREFSLGYYESTA